MAQSWIWTWWPFFVLMVAWVLISWWTGRLRTRSGRSMVELYEQQLTETKRNIDLYEQNTEEIKRNTAALERIAQALENRSR